MIVLTSFVEASRLEMERRSAARWAPSFAASWEEIAWMKPVRENGSAIKLRDFGEDPLEKYREYMLALYRARWSEIQRWAGALGEGDLAAACWCPYSRIAKAQIRIFGSFHCHLGVVAEVLESMGLSWRYGEQHEKLMLKRGDRI